MLRLTNEPITATLAGRKIRVRKLAFGRMIAIAQAAIVAEHVARIQMVAAGLPQGEREKAVAASIAAIPSGVTLDLQAGNWAASYEGGVRLIHEAMLQDQPGTTVEEVRELIDRADAGEVYPLACWVSGKGAKREGAPEEDGKKKTMVATFLRFFGR